jgi:murein DD-endopeptidase MepM/ murein hydrolase activator NlpD
MATADGVVTRAGWYSGYGYCVDIQHANGVTSRYGHLSSIKVSVGQTVSQYEVVALSGNTGNSTGPHVHFEIHINGTAVNPLNYVNKY